jgi:hypothetical protein
VLPGISCFEKDNWVTSLQNCAADAASEQSNVTFRTELLTLSSAFQPIHPSSPSVPQDRRGLLSYSSR